jgi:hypothetical protein
MLKFFLANIDLIEMIVLGVLENRVYKRTPAMTAGVFLV